ncbi:hypothetical protein [uncultured Tateyamaria sp.]|nr:hypothetical protein [uncultured Tateyamaria sp.]
MPWVRHSSITAVGADAPGKQELDPDTVARADLLCADSIAHCVDYDEMSHAAAAGRVDRENIAETGQILSGAASGRTSDTRINLADLTGIAAQDIAIANVVLAAHHAV